MYSSLPTIWWTILLLSVTAIRSEGVDENENADFVDSRCSCKCPETGSVDPDINNPMPNRKMYISTHVNATDCDCEHVVKPLLQLTQPQVDKFCPRCQCKHEKRSITIIKVVIIIVLWVVCVLIVYMLFLVALEPLLKGRARGRGSAQAGASYQQHTDDEESESVGDTPMRQYSRQVSARGVIGAVGHSQDRWKRQVEIQRRNIYDRHTMLN